MVSVGITGKTVIELLFRLPTTEEFVLELSNGNVSIRIIYKNFWIPAFAGMTDSGNL